MENKTFTIDLKKVKDPKGSFPCPKCGKVLNPSDDTDENYIIINTLMAGGKFKITLKCKGCNSLIKLVAKW